MRFDEPTTFEHALIGRQGPSTGDFQTTYASPVVGMTRGLITQSDGCQKTPYFSLEPGALKFGDKPQSHTQLYLNFANFWDEKKVIEFDFRTYYPDGLLFVTPVRNVENITIQEKLIQNFIY